ncbi:hypothetical protein ACVMFA_007275 [Bradyrhizobium liaoningense]|nr:hypothetical protein GCM10007858_11510 [Bradyrhizobium liaoningense]
MFWLAVKGDGFGAAFSHAFSGELEAVGVVDEAIENGVGLRNETIKHEEIEREAEVLFVLNSCFSIVV